MLCNWGFISFNQPLTSYMVLRRIGTGAGVYDSLNNFVISVVDTNAITGISKCCS